jgi:serine kinase of HPr protein (carbohydrate metabolism regulator)
MKISKIQELLDAKVLCGEEYIGRHVYSAFGCDLMSDVLAFAKDQVVLLTGLVNAQVIRTALMMDMNCIIFVRSKKPDEDMIRLAKEHEIVVMTTDKTLYAACGVLYSNGLVESREAQR